MIVVKKYHIIILLIIILMFHRLHSFGQENEYKMISVDSTLLEKYYIIIFNCDGEEINVLSDKEIVKIPIGWELLKVGNFYNIKIKHVHSIEIDNILFQFVDGPFYIGDKLMKNLYQTDQISGLSIMKE